MPAFLFVCFVFVALWFTWTRFSQPASEKREVPQAPSACFMSKPRQTPNMPFPGNPFSFVCLFLVFLFLFFPLREEVWRYVWVIAPGHLWELKASSWPLLSSTTQLLGDTIHRLMQTNSGGERNDGATFCTFLPATYDTRSTIDLDLMRIYISLPPIQVVTERKFISLFEKGRAWRTSRGSVTGECMENWWMIHTRSINNPHTQICINNNN